MHQIFYTMKKVILPLFLSFFSLSLSAQSHITSVEYQKIKRDAIVNEIPFPEKLVANAIKDTLEKLGYRGKDSKGYTVYKGVKLEALGKSEYDLYFSIDSKGRKDKDISIVTLMISKGFDDFAAEKSDETLIGNAKEYLDNLRNLIAVYDLEQQITEQDDVVKKNEKRSTSLVEEADDLQKQKKKLEKKIEENKKAQEDQVKENDKQKQVLETLRGKRKSF